MDTGHVLGLGLTIRREVGRSACWSLTLTLALTVTLTLTLALALALAPALILTLALPLILGRRPLVDPRRRTLCVSHRAARRDAAAL